MWVNFNGSTGSVTNSFNASSITTHSTGTYTINFSSAVSASTYCAIAGWYRKEGSYVNGSCIFSSDTSTTARRPSTTTVSLFPTSDVVNPTNVYCAVFL
jgi:hypothetical protein